MAKKAAKKSTKEVLVCEVCGEEPCACVEEAKPELKESGKPVVVKESKPKTVMRMLGGRMREVEVTE